MNLTLRYIKVPATAFFHSHEGDEVKSISVQTQYRINPFDISAYYPSVDDDPENFNCVEVILKCGEKVYVDMTIEEFEKKLESFD